MDKKRQTIHRWWEKKKKGVTHMIHKVDTLTAEIINNNHQGNSILSESNINTYKEQSGTSKGIKFNTAKSIGKSEEATVNTSYSVSYTTQQTI